MWWNKEIKNSCLVALQAEKLEDTPRNQQAEREISSHTAQLICKALFHRILQILKKEINQKNSFKNSWMKKYVKNY